MRAERDRLAGELAEAKRMHQNAAANGYDISQKLALVTLERDEWKGSALSLGAKWDELDDTARALTADLAAARAELARWQEDHESQTARAMCAEEQERIRAHDLAAARKTIAAYEEALTPSAETKSAFWGEFEIVNTQLDDDGEEYTIKSFVPWDAVKEIMKAIRARAAIPQANKTKETES